MNSPLVSVILPVHNAKAFLRPALESVLHQTYSNLEVIAIDDGSSDGSSEILRCFARRDSRIRLHSRENRGLVATLNEGLDLAKGQLLARMDADDICYLDRIERQVEAFESDRQLCLCGMCEDYLYSPNRVTLTTGSGLNPRQFRLLNVFYPVINHPVAMMSNEYIQKFKLRYSQMYPHAEDFDLFRRIVRDGRAILLEKKGLLYRCHDHGNVSTVFADQQIHSHLSIVSEQLSAFGISPRGRVLLEILSPGWVYNDNNWRSIFDLFLELKDFTRLAPDEQQVYERGIEVLARLVFSVLSLRVRPDLVLEGFQDAGLLLRVSRRDQLFVVLARIVGARTAHQMTRRVAKIVDYLKAVPVEQVIPELGAWSDACCDPL
jgi:hypothetical protein